VYLGPLVNVFVVLPYGDRLMVAEHNRGEPIAVGDTARLSFHARDAHVIERH
jgi:hypothetical protein